MTAGPSPADRATRKGPNPMPTPTIPRFSRLDRSAGIVDALRETGVVIVDDLLDREVIDTLLAEVEPHVRAADPGMTHVNEVLQTFFRGVRNVTGLAGKSPAFVASVLLNPLLLGAAEAILGPNCASIGLNVGHLMVREPGAPQQWLHRDEEVWSFVPRPHAELELSSVVALCDFDRANGATAVVPGSHRWERDRRPEPDEVVKAEMPAGGAVVYLGSTIHAGGTNESDRPRAGLHLSYVVGWLRTEENNCLATPPETARSLPRRAQELLGYGMHDAAAMGGGYLGALDLHDPVDLLASGRI